MEGSSSDCSWNSERPLLFALIQTWKDCPWWFETTKHSSRLWAQQQDMRFWHLPAGNRGHPLFAQFSSEHCTKGFFSICRSRVPQDWSPNSQVRQLLLWVDNPTATYWKAASWVSRWSAKSCVVREVIIHFGSISWRLAYVCCKAFSGPGIAMLWIVRQGATRYHTISGKGIGTAACCRGTTSSIILFVPHSSGVLSLVYKWVNNTTTLIIKSLLAWN